MTGLANAASAKADTTTRKNANILASTATSVAVTEALNVAEEGEKIGTTTTVTKTDTGTQKVRRREFFFQHSHWPGQLFSGGMESK